MKNLNKEQILFIAALVVLGMLAYFRIGDVYTGKRVPKSTGKLEVEPLPPCPEIQSIDQRTEFYSVEGRNIYAPPRDWLSLPPLLLDAPPKLHLMTVAPFPTPGLGERFFDVYHYLPGQAAAAPGEAGAAEQASAVPAEPTEGAGASSAFRLETVEEEAQDPEAAYLTVYDWIKLRDQVSRIYGYIRNVDRYALPQRPGELIRFAQVAKRTGNILGEYEYARDRIENFGFADTVVNRIELEIRKINFNAGNLDTIHEKARWCLSFRKEDPKAIDYAIDLVERALELDPLSKDSYTLLADIHEIAFDREAELETLKAAIRQGLNAPGVHVRYGRLLRRYGMDDAALQAYLEAERITPEYAEALVARAELYLDQGQALEALDLFERARRSATWKVDLKMRVLLGKGRCKLAMNDLSEASIEAQYAINEEEDNGDAWNLKGSITYVKGDSAGAVEAFQKAVELDPLRARYLMNLGIAFFKKGDLKGARRKFDETVAMDPYYSCRPSAARGFVNECLQDDGAASADYELAVQVDPLDFYALYLLGRDQRRQGDMEASIETLRQALRRNGEMREILGELGHSCLLAGLNEDAAFYFEEYLKRGEGDFRLHYLYGLALLNLGRPQEAISRFERSLGLSRRNPDPFNGLAYAHYALGNVDAALDAFTEVIRSFEEDDPDPRHEYAKRWRLRIEEHRRKSQWLDGFQRKEIKNDWVLHQRCGPAVTLINNRVILQGAQRQQQPDERTAIRREGVKGDTFRVFEAEITQLDGNQAQAGIFMGAYIERGRATATIRAEVTLALDPSGNLVFNVIDNNTPTVEWQRIDRERIEQDAPVNLGIEVVDFENGALRLYADGEPLLEGDLLVKGLRRSTRDLTLGAFGAAPGSRKVHVAVDNVRIVVQN